MKNLINKFGGIMKTRCDILIGANLQGIRVKHYLIPIDAELSHVILDQDHTDRDLELAIERALKENKQWVLII